MSFIIASVPFSIPCEERGGKREGGREGKEQNEMRRGD